MPVQSSYVFEVPSALHILLRVLAYSAGAVISGLGGFHGYRSFRGTPSDREAAEAERLRDEIVFGDDFDKLGQGGGVEGLTSAEHDGALRPVAGKTIKP